MTKGWFNIKSKINQNSKGWYASKDDLNIGLEDLCPNSSPAKIDEVVKHYCVKLQGQICYDPTRYEACRFYE